MAERVGFEPTERFPVHSISSAASSTTPAPLRIADCQFPVADWSYGKSVKRLRVRSIGNRKSAMFLAERVGFEPTVGVNPLRFSRPVH